ncbi:glyoxalase [Sorangium cellulosum]|uniref:Glyoxalase n=1 Tax=Sorangium cellulosum TaxID=56 RepID=A0A2L0F2K3_SORCE|nr:VOC family protein [Sorangium cellulosum]AUX45808.1 glyoxalase [Sorangium cellulosum]
MPRVIHFEVHADDPQRAMRFYAEVFGWQFERFGQIDYWSIQTGDAASSGIDGGLMPRRGPRPPEGQPVNAYPCTIEVDDIDLYLKKVATADGKNVVPKMAIPGVGWLAYCHDTEGNVFGLMQPDPSAA